MNIITSAEKKMGLDEIADKEDTLLHNSNMANLAGARRYCIEGIEAAQAEISRLAALKTEIETFVSDEKNLMNTTEVSRLHGLAREPQVIKNNRW